jgi:hypothetical protein
MTRSLIRETEETQYSLPPGAMRSATGWWRASLSRTDWVRDRRRSGSLRPRARTPAQHDLVAGLSEEGIRNIGTGPSGYEPALVLLRSSGLGHSTQTQGRGWELRSFEPPICRGLVPCALCLVPCALCLEPCALSLVPMHELLRLERTTSRATRPLRGGLPVRKQKRVVEFIEDHLAEEISLATPAELVPKRISPSSREPGFQVRHQGHTYGRRLRPCPGLPACRNFPLTTAPHGSTC